MSGAPRYLVSHLVHRWHNLLVPTPGRVELEHRGTGERRSVDQPVWSAISRAARRPATESEIAAAAGSPAKVRELVEARFLAEPDRDFWSDYVHELDGSPPDLPRDRLAWARDVIDTHRLWLYPTWLGFPVLQWPPDLFWMQAMLVELRPAFLVETGLFRGGSAMFYASVFELIGAGDVISVDVHVDREVRAAVEAHPLARRLSVIEGGSTDAATIERVAARIAGRGPVVVVLDSDHSTEHVRAELEGYARLVDRAGKIVVFDTSLSLSPRHAASNPHRAVRAFLAEHHEWRISPWAGASFVSCAEDGILERLP